MFKKIIFAFAAVLAANCVYAAEKVSFDMNDVSIEVKAEGVEITWFCKEPNMAYVKKYYAKPRWNVFSGEALEICFTPYSGSARAKITFPYYRMLVNPSNRYITAFLTPDWSSAGVFPKVEKVGDDGWQVKWFIQYAALESSFYNTGKGKAIRMQNKWRFDFKYRRSAGGKNEVLSAKPFILNIPETTLAGYRQCVLKGVKAIPGQGGKVTLEAQLVNTAKTPFSGKAQWILYSDGKPEVCKELPVYTAASGTMDCRAEITLPEQAVKFATALQIIDAKGKVIRLSRKLALNNPYVE
ncbi:MAG: hypothetical protein IKC89_02270 [Lentisphaeria bacterium]|nr:hypothetical protein [Lentisphaeria bacterium]